MFLVPLTMRDFFFEDPYFQSSWCDYDRLRNYMFRQPRDVWKKFDNDFRQLACMANNIMVDPTSRPVPIQQQRQQQQVEGGQQQQQGGQQLAARDQPLEKRRQMDPLDRLECCATCFAKLFGSNFFR